MNNDNYDYPYDNYEYEDSYAGLPVSQGYHQQQQNQQQQHGHHQANQQQQQQPNQYHHHHHQQQQQQYHQPQHQHQFQHYFHQQPQQQQQHQHYQQESSDYYQVHQVTNNSNSNLSNNAAFYGLEFPSGHGLQASTVSAGAATAGSSPSSSLTGVGSSSHSTVSTFTNLAKTVNVKLPKSLTKHLLTLLRLGVPPDDVYLFLKECIESLGTRV